MDTQSSVMNTALITDLRLLRCPISMTFCYDPVIAEDGYTYERRCIEAHFENKQTSPMTNQPIGISLTSNLILKQIIQNVLDNISNLQKEFDDSKKEYSLKLEKELFAACESDNTNKILLLIKQGVNVNGTVNNGMTPLYIACHNGHVDVARMLLDKGAEVDRAETRGGWTPLHAACGNGHVDVALLLLEKGAEVNRASKYGNTPLAIARKKGYLTIVSMLEDHVRMLRRRAH